MSLLVGLLLVIVSLAGAFVVVRVVEKFVRGSADAHWEYLIVVLIGAGLLIWPVARQASLRGAERTLAQYRQILELEDLESYRLVKADSGETLEIVEDKESGEFQLKATGVTEPEPQESEEEPPGESPTPTPPQAESPAPETP
jgi:hypothetical protein